MSITPQRLLRRFVREAGGSAALEFATGSAVVILGVLNAIDMGYYEYERMEVENAAQVGAQAAWKACYDTSYMLPATVNCSSLNNAITAAIQSTTLGTGVSLTSGYPTEGYYCVDSTGALSSVGSLASKPSNCSAVGNANTTPGDYIQVSVTFAYSPLFPGVSVMGAWGVTSISMTSWMRLG